MQIFPQLFSLKMFSYFPTFSSFYLELSSTHQRPRCVKIGVGSLTEVRVWLSNLDDPLFLSAPTDQIRTIDKRRLKNRIASLTSDEVTALQDVLRQMFCEQIVEDHENRFLSNLIENNRAHRLVGSNFFRTFAGRLSNLLFG